MPPSYVLRPGRLADGPAASRLYATAFAGESLFDYMFPNRHSQPAAFNTWVDRLFQTRYWTPGYRLTMLVERDPVSGREGRAVAYAWWKRPKLTFREKWLTPFAWFSPIVRAWHKFRDWLFPLPVPYPDRLGIFFRTFSVLEPQILSTPRRREAWYLSSLGVDPEIQSQGLGSMVLQDGLREADEAGVATWLVGLKGVERYYVKFGFVEVGRANVGELKDWEGGSIMFRGE